MKFTIFSLLVAMSALTARASVPSLSEVRSQYLEKPLETSISIEVPRLNLQFLPKRDGATSTSFEPNAHMLVGVGLGYDGYRATLALPAPSSRDSLDRKGATNHYDLILHRQWHASGLDFLFETYQGFYLAGTAPENDGSTSRFSQRPDVGARHIGLNYHFVFSPERYQMENSQMADLSVTRGGSLLLLAALDQNRLWADRPFVEDSLGMVGGEFLSATVGAGYGYQFKRERHSLRGQLGLGFGPQRQRIETVAGPVIDKLGLGGKVNAFGNYTFAMASYALGIDIDVDEVVSTTAELQITASVASALLFARTSF